MSSVAGLCDDVTSGAVVDVFYTRAGRSQRTALYLLVGAKITYVLLDDLLASLSSVIVKYP